RHAPRTARSLRPRRPRSRRAGRAFRARPAALPASRDFTRRGCLLRCRRPTSDEDDALWRYVVPVAARVIEEIAAEHGVVRNHAAAVDDDAVQHAVAPDLHIGEQHGILYARVRAYLAVRRHDRLVDVSANDGALADDRRVDSDRVADPRRRAA